MRKPRDIDAELKALSDRTKALKSRKITQLGELVLATGAGDLDAEVLAGLLIATLHDADSEKHDAWRRAGQAFFQRANGKRGAAAKAGQSSPSGEEARRADATGAGGQGAL